MSDRQLTEVNDLDEFVRLNDRNIRMNEVIRCYQCEAGHKFVEIVKKKEKVCNLPCPACDSGSNSMLDSIIMGPVQGMVRGNDPTTVGQCAERNSRKLSKYLLSEQRQAKTDARKTWYNPDGKDLTFINKMSDKEKQNYILTGDTNGK